MTPDTIDFQEQERLRCMLVHEEAAYLKGYCTIAGIDEAGRGPLAGPVVAAACILPRGMLIPYVNDSKKLKPKIRKLLFDRLTADTAIRYGVGIIDPATIDQINILQATIQAMLQAVEKLDFPPDYLLVDGLKLPHPVLPAQKIIKGDQLSQSIAAASIIAKETRDALMCAYDEQWPQYGFAQHKGYGTAQHLEAIDAHGPCPIHRTSFAPFTGPLASFTI